MDAHIILVMFCFCSAIDPCRQNILYNMQCGVLSRGHILVYLYVGLDSQETYDQPHIVYNRVDSCSRFLCVRNLDRFCINYSSWLVWLFYFYFYMQNWRQLKYFFSLDFDESRSTKKSRSGFFVTLWSMLVTRLTTNWQTSNSSLIVFTSFIGCILRMTTQIGLSSLPMKLCFLIFR